ncbi:guided entry of tail-anchored proteins factor 1-like isoform X2 [Protopterus annectens]|uniref:guided entry of tail-anchored proteins factor 1-like isoform X2 n=1 Tax=Protopterus annectens TaxID=7888 RepID=UPI001CF9642F|nr:guided entry of tail-anchored proteins factor 1-like isoform X2 [Protopterus annectens]
MCEETSKLLQKDAEQESGMRLEIQNMKQELSSISMMDEFARYARLERKINKMTDRLKTHVKARTAQLAKIKWVVNIVFYVFQAALMVTLIWKYYSEPVIVLPSKWVAPLERLVAFPTGIAAITVSQIEAVSVHAYMGTLKMVNARSKPKASRQVDIVLGIHTFLLLRLTEADTGFMHFLKRLYLSVCLHESVLEALILKKSPPPQKNQIPLTQRWMNWHM